MELRLNLDIYYGFHENCTQSFLNISPKTL